MSLQHRLNNPVVTEGKTELELLFDRFQELKSVGRQVEEELKKLRPEIDQAMNDGLMVGYADAHLTIQKREGISCDMEDLIADLGEKIALRCADISATKLRKMIDAGVVPADAKYLKRTETSALVTNTTAR